MLQGLRCEWGAGVLNLVFCSHSLILVTGSSTWRFMAKNSLRIVVVSAYSMKNHSWSLGVLIPEDRNFISGTIKPKKPCREISRIFIELFFSLGVFYTHTVYGITMQSGDLNFMFLKNKGPIIYFAKRKNMTSSFPLCLHFSYRVLYMQANTRDYNIRISWYINSYIHIDCIRIIYLLINSTIGHSPLWDLLSLTFTCLYPECCFIIQSHQLSLPSD